MHQLAYMLQVFTVGCDVYTCKVSYFYSTVAYTEQRCNVANRLLSTARFVLV